MPLDEHSKAFVAWLRSSGVEISANVAIEDRRSSGEGRCIVASQDIAKDEVLFTIPRSALLNVENCSLIRDIPGTRAKIESLPQWQALILILLYEWKVKADTSPWWDYLCVLPLVDRSYTMNQLIFWKDDELQQLKPSLVLERIGHDSASKMYNGLLPDIEAYVGQVTMDDFHLAASVIMSYSFDVDDEADIAGAEETNSANSQSQGEDVEVKSLHHDDKSTHESDGESESDDTIESVEASSDSENLDVDEEDNWDEDAVPVANCSFLKSMVPFADTLNADTKKHNASLFIKQNHLEMKSIQEIKQGSEVYNIYSEQPNSETLRRYGYVECAGSEYDFGEVSLATLKKYFAENSSLSIETIEEIISILREIESEEHEPFVLNSYDCYATAEVIFELTFIIQLFVIIAAINHKKSFNSASSEVKARAIRRVYSKCYQLLESRKLTAQFIANYENIIKLRLAEYPKRRTAALGKYSGSQLSREEMADVVLSSEYAALKTCMDTDKVFRQGNNIFSIIDDDKLLRNILKKDIFEGSDVHPKKKIKIT